MTPAQKSAVGRRVVSFSLLGLFAVIIALGLFRPEGVVDSEKTEFSVASKKAALKGSDVTWRHVPALFITGVCAGLLSGLIGMGGGVLKMLSMLLFLSFDIFFARAISVVTMFCSSVGALYGFVRLRMIAWSFAIPMVLAGIPAAIFGAVIGNDLHENTLRFLFALFVVFLGLNTFAFVLGDPDERAMRNDVADGPGGREGYLCSVIGGLHGMTCGLLGISGGVIATPMQQLTLRMPLRVAIGNTLVVSTAVTLAAAIFVLTAGMQRGDFTLGNILFVDLFMGGGALIGAPIGTALGQRWNVTGLRLLFVALTLTAGFSILS